MLSWQASVTPNISEHFFLNKVKAWIFSPFHSSTHNYMCVMQESSYPVSFLLKDLHVKLNWSFCNHRSLWDLILHSHGWGAHTMTQTVYCLYQVAKIITEWKVKNFTKTKSMHIVILKPHWHSHNKLMHNNGKAFSQAFHIRRRTCGWYVSTLHPQKLSVTECTVCM